MPDFSIADCSRLLDVSPDTVRRWIEAGRLAATRDAADHLRVDGEQLAAFAVASAPVPPATASRARSARNRFTGLVTAVRRDGVMAQVEIQAGPHRLVSLISREAADELQLAPGVLAVASVKATSVVIELPGDPRRSA